MPSGVTGIGGSAFSNCTSLVSVSLPSGLKTIGNSAFSGCSVLENITMPDSLESIGSSAFSNCKKLEGVSLPGSLKELESNAFSNCTGLKSIILPAGLESIGNYAFSGCTSLASASLPSGLAEIGSYAFRNCTNLESVTIPSSVTSIGGSAFAGGVKSVVFGAGTTVIPDNACSNADKVTSITVPSGVTGIGGSAFSNCTSLVSVSLPSGLKTIGNSAFSGCSVLENITMPDSLESIGNSAFSNCKKLEGVSLPGSLKELESNVFSNCTGLKSITLPAGLESIGNYAFSGCTSLASASLPSGLAEIGSYAFRNCTNLESVTIPSSVTSIGGSAFAGGVKSVVFGAGTTVIPDNACSNADKVTSITVPSGVTGIGGSAFSNCTSLVSVSLPSGLKTIGNSAFSGCSVLENITMPDSLESIGNSAFSNCKKLEGVSLPGSLKELESNVFSNCTGLKSITLPAGLESIGNYAFSGCASLTSASLPSGLAEIGSYAFRNCTNLVVLELPDGLKTLGNYTFQNCTSLKEININNGVTIGNNCFEYCSGLVKIKIGNDVVIKSYAFRNCITIEELIFGKNVNREINSFYGVVISGSCGSDVNYVLNIESGEMSFSGSGDIPNYSVSSPAPWNKLASVVNYLDISEGISSIGDYAFNNFDNIESIELPNGIKVIGKNVFYSCDQLSYIEVPDSVQNISDSAFSECDALNELVFCGNAPTFGKDFIKNSPGINIYYPVTATGWGSLLQQTYNLCKWQTWDNTVQKKDIVLLLDVSGSMSGKINKLKEAAEAFINGMAGRRLNTKISIVSYESSAKLVSDFTTSKKFLINRLSELSASGGTTYTDALKQANDLLKDSEADQKSIVMFSDGEPGDSTTSIYSLADNLRSTYTIYTVGLLSSDSQRNILKTIAGSDDRYFEADQIKDLLEAFSQLVKDFDREENTIAKIQRHNVTYDLFKEKAVFCVGSLEYAAISIIPGNKLGDFSRVDILKGDSIVKSSENGIFNNIQPGLLFSKGDEIFSAVYDDAGNLLEKMPLNVSISDAYSVKFMLNDGTDTVYKTDSIVGGLDLKEPDKPVRSGYKFKGWYATKECVGFSFFSTLNSLNRLKIENDITLYAKWISSMEEDIWSFTNTSDNYCTSILPQPNQYEIRSGDFAKLIEELDTASAKKIKEFKKSEWGGSCFGMSSAVVLNSTDIINISNFDANYQNIRMAEIDKNYFGNIDVGVIESMINYYMLRQNIGNIGNIRTNYSKIDESSNIINIINKLKYSKNPCVITITLSENGKELGGHAVVGYDLKIKNNDEYEFKVYDCSIGPNNVYIVNVNANNGRYSAICSDWENDWNVDSIFFKTALTPEELISESYLTAPSVIKKRNATKAGIEEKYILNTSYDTFSITDGTSSAKIVDGNLESGSLNILCKGIVNNIEQDTEYEFELPVLSDGKQYTIDIEDKKVDLFNTSLFYDNVQDGFFVQASAKEGGKIIFSADGGVKTNYDAEIEQYVTVATNKSQMPWSSVALEGLSNGLMVTPGSEKFELYSQNNANADITLESKHNNYTFKDISLSQNETDVIEDKEGNCEIICDNKKVVSVDFGYAVVFDSQAGSNVDTLFNVKKDSKISEPTEPHRDGYMFAGWFKDKECKNFWDFDTDVITSDTILYAGWELDDNYFITVTFKLKGTNNQILTLSQGSILKQENCPKSPDGGQLIWYTDNNCSLKWNFEDAFQMNTVLYSEGWEDNFDEKHTHNYVSDWKSNDKGHWKECECGEKSSIEAHKFVWVTEPATTTQPEIKYEKCNICGYINKGTPSPLPSSSVKPSNTSQPSLGGGGSSSGGSGSSGSSGSTGGGGAVITPTPTPVVTLTPSPSPVTITTPTPKPSASTNPGTGSGSIVNNNSKKEIIYDDVMLNKKSVIYNGKEKKPSVTVLSGSLELTKNKDYTVSYLNNKNVGTATVVVNGIGNYTGNITKSFKIIPRGTPLKGKVKPRHKGFTVNWKKQPESITGYQIQYSTSKKFKGKTTVIKTIQKKSVTKLKASKLKAKKKYYVRVRTYKTVKGKKYYSRWSKSKTVKTKK